MNCDSNPSDTPRGPHNVLPFKFSDYSDLYGRDMYEAIGRAIAALADGAVDQLHATGAFAALTKGE